MKEELDALLKTCTWDLVDLPADRSAIGCKWVYKIATRLALLPRDSLMGMDLTMMRRHLPRWLTSLLFVHLLRFLLLAIEHYFRWM